ncbi:hypothetical protein PG985_011449 [Apiospora marii]|uniref:Uncharacterized protein n=1 Tax=Apiospora marii TaxID=335849 RepID=A0ABR1STR0_9PEZI
MAGQLGVGGLDEGGNQADKAVKQICMMHQSGADTGALNSIYVGVVSAQFTKVLRFITAPEVGRPSWPMS